MFDPNVLISAVVASGVSAQLLDRWLEDRPFDMVVCPMLIEELRGVLTRDRFRRWLSIDEVEHVVSRLQNEAEMRADPADIPAVTRDPKDDYLVALYRDAGADLLISGDSDLLDVKGDTLTVLSPRELLDRL